MMALVSVGYEPILAPSALWDESRRPTPAELAADVEWCFTTPGIDVVMATTGGTRSAEIIPYLDVETLRRSKRPFCGFSDISALVVWLHYSAGVRTFHGPTLLPSFGDVGGVDEYTARAFRHALLGIGGELHPPQRTSSESLYWDAEDGRPRAFTATSKWRSCGRGRASGRILAAHLGTLVSAVIDVFPLRSPTILCLESNEGSAVELLSQLEQLRAVGLENVEAVVFGRCPELDDAAAVDHWFQRFSAQTGMPTLLDVDFGHTVPMLTLQTGAIAIVDADRKLLSIVPDHRTGVLPS